MVFAGLVAIRVVIGISQRRDMGHTANSHSPLLLQTAQDRAASRNRTQTAMLNLDVDAQRRL